MGKRSNTSALPRHGADQVDSFGYIAAAMCRKRLHLLASKHGVHVGGCRDLDVLSLLVFGLFNWTSQEMEGINITANTPAVHGGQSNDRMRSSSALLAKSRRAHSEAPAAGTSDSKKFLHL